MPVCERRRNSLSRTALVAACAVAFALDTSTTLANTVYVTSCADAGAGSLRAAVAPITAANGDTIDLTTLTCSKISLTTGEIVIQQNDLTLFGPGANKLTIDGKYLGRVIDHQGGGTLTISNVSVVNGYDYSANFTVRGGCVYSVGSVTLDHAVVSQCKATAASLYASGGGVFVAGKLIMQSSAVRNSAVVSPNNFALGGGIAASRSFEMSYSTISGSSATSGFGSNAAGGGAYVNGDAFINFSTISGNTSTGANGGIGVTPAFATHGDLYSFQMTNSTISGNHAGTFVGGAYSKVLTRITNTTIAFNTAGVGSFNAGGATRYMAPGLTVFQDNARLTANVDGLLAAGNTYGSNAKENDFDATGTTIAGDHNLIRVSDTGLPGSNLAGVCPLLGPLRDNGGPTQTHALLSRSPAIDAGTMAQPGYDQRGPIHVRSSGPSQLVDIGAYEVQQDDIVFNASFDGCPGL